MKFTEIDHTLHCAFSERLDGPTCSALEQNLEHRIVKFKKKPQNTRIVFDLDEAKYISSSFLRLCLIYLKTFGKDNFTVTGASREMYKVFHISGFTEIMNVIPSDDAPPFPA